MRSSAVRSALGRAKAVLDAGFLEHGAQPITGQSLGAAEADEAQFGGLHFQSPQVDRHGCGATSERADQPAAKLYLEYI